jgi:hypothetical protein
MRRWHRRHLPADGDVPLPIGKGGYWCAGRREDVDPPADVQSGAILPDQPTAESVTARLRDAATGSEALTSRDRYQLMLRFNLTPAQVDRTPVDVTRTLLATLD